MKPKHFMELFKGEREKLKLLEEYLKEFEREELQRVKEPPRNIYVAHNETGDIMLDATYDTEEEMLEDLQKIISEFGTPEYHIVIGFLSM